MKFASLRNGSRDGQLVLVSRDLRRAVDAAHIAPTLQAALENWVELEPQLQALYAQLQAGHAEDAFDFDPAQALAPLPRSHQFVDASAFLNHGRIMDEAYKLTIKKTPGMSVMVPRQGDDFRGPRGDYEFPDVEDQCDFEGEFAAITDDVPMGATPEQAQAHIRLITFIDDVSMRKHLIREIQIGFGLIQAKPATIFAPVAVTPDELGEAWQNGRVALDMRVARNGKAFGHPNGREMDWSFGELIAQVAYNRRLRAGFVLGSGTVSNRTYREVGSACLAEQRAVETIDHGEARTPFVQFGESLQFEVLDDAGASVFGAIDVRFVQAARAAG
ncbi:MAG: fumarylacetoacetate hydrolase family protein [Rudaea sp.]|uniref:fumarylacetoacetate hydrolase family protein n=1 Tax=Rudaea sp. TaxID=2136325 RepID=UPI0039E2225F